MSSPPALLSPSLGHRPPRGPPSHPQPAILHHSSASGSTNAASHLTVAAAAPQGIPGDSRPPAPHFTALPSSAASPRGIPGAHPTPRPAALASAAAAAPSSAASSSHSSGTAGGFISPQFSGLASAGTLQGLSGTHHHHTPPRMNVLGTLPQHGLSGAHHHPSQRYAGPLAAAAAAEGLPGAHPPPRFTALALAPSPTGLPGAYHDTHRFTAGPVAAAAAAVAPPPDSSSTPGILHHRSATGPPAVSAVQGIPSAGQSGHHQHHHHHHHQSRTVRHTQSLGRSSQFMHMSGEPEIQPYQEEPPPSKWQLGSSYGSPRPSSTRPVLIPGRGGDGAVRSYRVITSGSGGTGGVMGDSTGGNNETTLVIMEGDDEGTDLLGSSAAQRSMAGSQVTPDQSLAGGSSYHSHGGLSSSYQNNAGPLQSWRDTSGLLPHNHRGSRGRRSSHFFGPRSPEASQEAANVLNRALGGFAMRRSRSSSNVLAASAGGTGMGNGGTGGTGGGSSTGHAVRPPPPVSIPAGASGKYDGLTVDYSDVPGRHSAGHDGYVVGAYGRSSDSESAEGQGLSRARSGGLARTRRVASLADIQATVSLACTWSPAGLWGTRPPPNVTHHETFYGESMSRNVSYASQLGNHGGGGGGAGLHGGGGSGAHHGAGGVLMSPSPPTTPSALPVCLICLEMLTPNDFRSGNAIELQCACKGDMALRHLECAIEWSNYKGNITCDICKMPILNLPPVDPAIAAAREARRRRRLPNFSIGAPNFADYLFDALCVTWGVMLICVLFLDIPFWHSFALGSVTGGLLPLVTACLKRCRRWMMSSSGRGSGSSASWQQQQQQLRGAEGRDGGWLADGPHVLQQPLLPGGCDSP